MGHDRFEGDHAYRQLAELYRAVRLYVNSSQPSMKLRLWPPRVYRPAHGAGPHHEEVRVAQKRIAETLPASAILHTGTKIIGRHGLKIGTVDELLADEHTGAITELIAKRGVLDFSEVRIPTVVLGIGYSMQ